jgi:hypothetical protein
MKLNANGEIFAIILEKSFSCKRRGSGQEAKKRRKCIYFDWLLFLLPIMQQRDTSGNITPPPSANESEPQDITAGTEMGESSHATNATCYG